MTVVIRKALPSEADAISQLIFRSKRSNGYDDAFMDACRTELTVSKADLAGDFWVAEQNGILGCACLKNGEVITFFVAPESKRQGVGRALWARLLARAQQLGMKNLQLDADPAAVPFYQSMGFEVVGEVPSGSIAGRMLPLMSRKIDS